MITSQVDKTGPFLITALPQVIPVGFPFRSSADLLVLDAGASGTGRDPAVTLTLGSDYTVTGGGYNGANQMQTGSITVASTGSHSVITGDYITIMRQGTLTQDTAFSPPGPSSIVLLEKALDKIATLEQQINEIAGRALQFERIEILDPVLLRSSRSSKYQAYDANGVPIFLSGTAAAVNDATLSTVTATGSTTARALGIRFSEMVNAKDFGAVGDGVTDDTTAINAAITYATGVGGGVVKLSRGTYLVTQIKMKTKVWLQGAGAAATIVKNTSTTIYYPGSGYSPVIVNNDFTNGDDNLIVSDLTVQRTQTNAAAFFELIGFSNCDYVRIFNCKGIAAGSSALGNKGFATYGCAYVWITDNYIENVPDNSIVVAWDGTRFAGYSYIARNTIKLSGNWVHSAIIVTADYGKIADNTFFASSANSFPTMVELGDEVYDVLVSGNTAINAGLLLALSGERLRIVDNYCEANSSAKGIALTSNGGVIKDILIEGNIFKAGRVKLAKGTSAFQDVSVLGNMVIGGTGEGILCETITNIRIQGNTVNGAATVGISCTACVQVTVTANTSHGNTSHGFYLENTPTDGTIHGNTSFGNTGYGFSFDQPQNWNFTDNTFWSNTAGTVQVTNATVAGPNPFKLVRHSGTGIPNFYAQPGSTYQRSDGGMATALYIKESAITSSVGWLPVAGYGKGSDIASAANITLGVGNFFMVTGTTNVTSVTAAVAGRQVTLQFDNALTFTDGSNLILAGNFVTTSNDTITLISDGTNWNEVCRSVN